MKRKKDKKMMTVDYSASNLYDGGWRAEDKEQLMAEYELTEEEADQICAELAECEARANEEN